MACALEGLFRSHYEPLCELAGRYVGCPDGAEDVVQDVFTRLWERPALWQACREPRRYLYVAVRNRALQHRAHRQVARKVRDTLEQLGESVGTGEGAPRPDEDVAAKQLMTAFHDSVTRLPRRRHEAYMEFWRGRTQAEIAEEMGVSVRTVETHVGQARRALHRELAAWT
jgi:RNA polymerase sigma-70 factor, ECF subfamily